MGFHILVNSFAEESHSSVLQTYREKSTIYMKVKNKLTNTVLFTARHTLGKNNREMVRMLSLKFRVIAPRVRRWAAMRMHAGHFNCA